MDTKAIELAELIAKRKHDTGTPEYTLAIALLECLEEKHAAVGEYNKRLHTLEDKLRFEEQRYEALIAKIVQQHILKG